MAAIVFTPKLPGWLRAALITLVFASGALVPVLSLYPGHGRRSAKQGRATTPAPNKYPEPEAWNIQDPVPSFTGRESQLEALHAQLQSGQRVALIPAKALYGMAGIGKTQLARAYAKRYRAEYRLGWWIPAQKRLEVTTALGELGAELDLPRNIRPPQLAAQLYGRLAHRPSWLLVFDNAEDPAALAKVLPSPGQGHVLITSRNPAWHGLADPISVDLLPLDEAVKLLQRRSGNRDHNAAERLAKALGRLPLALEQAAAYAGEQHMSLARYHSLFQVRRAEMLRRGKPADYQTTVHATFSLAAERVGNRAAVQLLEVCALLAPDRLPVDLLLTDPQALPHPLADAARHPLEKGEAVGALYRASLLTEEAPGTARIHRLVQVVIVSNLAPSDRKARVEQTVKLLAALFPGHPENPGNWVRCMQLLSHAQAVFDHARDQVVTPQLTNLLNNCAEYVRARGLDVTTARDWDEQALKMRRELLNRSGVRLDIGQSLNNLAEDLRRLGGPSNFAAARKLDEEALEMRRRFYISQTDISQSLNNLAEDLRGLGGKENVAVARKLDEEALEMRRRLYGDRDHRDIGQSLSNLAKDLRKLGGKGNLTAARKVDEEALEMLERLSAGRDDPEFANSLTAVAEYHRQLGEWSEARELDERALQMRRRLYGDGDPAVRQNMRNLAKDLRGLGGAEDLAAARKLEADVLAMPRPGPVGKEAGRIGALIRALLRRMRAAMYALSRAFPPTGIY